MLLIAYRKSPVDHDMAGIANALLRSLLMEKPSEEIAVRTGRTGRRESSLSLAGMQTSCEAGDVGLRAALVQVAAASTQQDMGDVQARTGNHQDAIEGISCSSS